MRGGRLLRQVKWHMLHGRALEYVSLGLLGALIVGPLSILMWLLFSTDIFTIQTITIVDARPHTESTIREQTVHLLGKNILLAETQSLASSVTGAIPQIRDIRIERKLPSALKIVVQEKTPALLLLSASSYHFVDKQGIAYEEALLETLPGVVLPVIKNTGEQGSVELGAPVVNADFVQFILQAQEELPKLAGADIVEIRIPSLAAREVHMLLANNWLIRFDTSRPLAIQLDILHRLLDGTISEESQPQIEYIDLRIPNRVYYKLTDS